MGLFSDIGGSVLGSVATSAVGDVVDGAVSAVGDLLPDWASGLFGDLFGESGEGSLWDGINPYLIASIGPCDCDGAPSLSGSPVQCLLVDDANFEFQLSWQSPFEGAGPETKAPTLMAMLQSGELQPLIDRLPSSDATSAVENLADMARGRTGVTKLNSTQVFAAMPPARLQATLLFRAWSDPQSEVEDPLNALMEMALPELAEEGTLLTALIDLVTSDESITAESAIEKALPSKAPTQVYLSYKGKTFAPLVIEQIGIPLNSPSDEYGRFVQIQVPVTFATLRAFDKGDWSSASSGDSSGLGDALGDLASDLIGGTVGDIVDSIF